MRVICPHCRTVYELQTEETDAVLVCHRCGTEFGLGEKPEGARDVDANELRAELTPDIFTATAEPASVVEPPAHEEPADEVKLPPPPSMPPGEEFPAGSNPPSVEEDMPEPEPEPEPVPLEEETPTPAPPEPVHNETPAGEIEPEEEHESAGIVPAHEQWGDEQPGSVPPFGEEDVSDEPEPGKKDDTGLAGPPPRRKARIMPWLIAVMLLIVGGGLWLNQDAWLNDPWLRSVLLNAGIQLQVRDKDWQIDPNSVSATWLKRQGAGSVLVITGEVHNKLQADLPPPMIHVKLLARDNPDEIVLERDMIITRPPLMQAIRQAPYTPPPQDDTPIGALDKRGFVLVLENLPQNAGNFTLSPKARQ